MNSTVEEVVVHGGRGGTGRRRLVAHGGGAGTGGRRPVAHGGGGDTDGVEQGRHQGKSWQNRRDELTDTLE